MTVGILYTFFYSGKLYVILKCCCLESNGGNRRSNVCEIAKQPEANFFWADYTQFLRASFIFFGVTLIAVMG